MSELLNASLAGQSLEFSISSSLSKVLDAFPGKPLMRFQGDLKQLFVIIFPGVHKDISSLIPVAFVWPILLLKSDEDLL